MSSRPPLTAPSLPGTTLQESAGASETTTRTTASSCASKIAGWCTRTRSLRRFNRLVDRAGARRIHLHDVRHTYTTLSMDAGIDPKIVSDRVGHANMNVTLQVYTHRSTGRDREAAERIGDLIRRTISLEGAAFMKKLLKSF